MKAASLALAACLLTKHSVRASETIADIDFAKPGKEWHENGKGAFDGPLPEGMSPNFPSWNASVAGSTSLSENGRGFLRVKGEKLDQGMQFGFSLRNLTMPGNYRLTVSARLHGADLQLGIRQGPSPYRSFWSGTITPADGGWTEKNFLISLGEKANVPASLFLFLGRDTYDLASIKLVRLDAGELAKAIPRSPADSRNFFRNSRLPLGLQAGWNLDRSFAGGLIEADPTHPGPSGFPSLKLQGEKEITLYSEPFQTSDPLRETFVSFAAKGSGTWTLSIIYPRSKHAYTITNKKFQASPEWRVETLRLQLDEQAMAATGFALKISGTGTLNLDAFQAWQGSPERTYHSQNACEVALAIPESEFSATRIQFADESAKIVYCVTGDFTGAILKSNAVNAFGKTARLPDLKLGAPNQTSLETGTFPFAAFPDAPLGQCRIEVWVERGGKRISPMNEMLLTRIQRPVHLREDAPDSPFGGHFTASPLAIPLLKAAGINWARFHDASTDLIGWYHLETEKGKWTFHDEEINRYRAAHLKIFAGLQTAPLWASFYQDSGKKDINGYFDRYFPPKDLDAWTNYVRTVTARYKGVIDDYFIWNEPWGNSFWHTGYDAKTNVYLQEPDAPGEFAKLSIATYKAAKTGNPSARISGFNTINGANGSRWTKGVFDGGAYPYCDVVDFHFYTDKDQAQPDDQTASTLEDAIGYIKTKVPGFDKPLYMSEGQSNSTGSTGGAGYGLFKYALTWPNENDPISNADKTCRYIIGNLAIRCAKVFLYSSHGYSCLAVEPSFVTLVGPDGYPSVETAAFSHLAWQLEDSKFLRAVKLNGQTNAYLFTGRDGMIAVISGLRKAIYQVPANPALKTSDLFGNSSDGHYRGTLLYVTSKLPPDKLESVLAGTAR
ncbi:MAG: hypothetical protein Q8Q59_03715 [Luteolibacter sp.]|jgi:hypothetical protein|nr:hypothetical protein [Luteolibacter sp.]